MLARWLERACRDSDTEAADRRAGELVTASATASKAVRDWLETTLDIGKG